LVGEQFDQGDEICGAVLNFRARGDRISLWTKNAANEEAQVKHGCLMLDIYLVTKKACS